MATQGPKPSKDHHHTPRFYLGRWVDPADKQRRLWYYRREHGKLIEGRITPKGTGYEEHLYTARPATTFEKWREDLIETDLMSPLDDAASKVIEKLTAPEGPTALEDDERAAWARFVNSLLERHPRELNARDEKAQGVVDERMAQYRKQWTSERAQHAFDRILPQEMARLIVRDHMRTQIDDPTVLEYLSKHQWAVSGPIEGEPFITSDRPVLVNAQDGQTRPINFLSIALSPNHLFVSHPKEWTADAEKRAASLLQLVSAHNRLVVLAQPRFLYSASQIVDGPRVQLRTLVEEAFGMPPT